MFTGSTKNPPTKIPQPERLDEVYAALRRGLQSYLQVHQLELDSLGQQIRENKRNGRLGSLYEQDKQVKAIERFMRHLEFHLSKVEELYDAYCIQRRLRDGASKMVAAFNSATGSKEARESLSEANKGYRECTEHMCSLESDLESQMGEFHIKMKGLAGFARLCAGDQYEVLMRYGRQRWRLRGRVEVSNKQVWDSEDYIFLPLVTELLSIKVTELKSLANHVVVGSVSCEMLDLFCPLPQTLAVDINDLGTVKLNLEVTWSPFDKDDQASSTSTVSKRLLSNQSPPDTPSMREQVFYSTRHSRSLAEAFHEVMACKRTSVLHCSLFNTTSRLARLQVSLLKRQGELENGTVWSNSSESSDDSSSPAMGHHTQRLAASHTLQTTPTTQLSFAPRQSSASTPSLSSNQEEDESEAAEGFPQTDSGNYTAPNGHPQSSGSEATGDCVTDAPSAKSSDLSESSERLSGSYSEVFPRDAALLEEELDASDPGECSVLQGRISAAEGDKSATQESPLQVKISEGGVEDSSTKSGTPAGVTAEGPPEKENQGLKQEDALMVRCHSSSSFTLEVETALESFDFLNCSDLDEDEEEEELRDDEAAEEPEENSQGDQDHHQREEKDIEEEEAQEKGGEKIYTGSDDDRDDDEERVDLEILMEAPEGFRNSDEDCYSHSQASSTENLQDMCDMNQLGDAGESQPRGDDKRDASASNDKEDPSTPK